MSHISILFLMRYGFIMEDSSINETYKGLEGCSLDQPTKHQDLTYSQKQTKTAFINAERNQKVLQVLYGDIHGIPKMVNKGKIGKFFCVNCQVYAVKYSFNSKKNFRSKNLKLSLNLLVTLLRQITGQVFSQHFKYKFIGKWLDRLQSAFESFTLSSHHNMSEDEYYDEFNRIFLDSIFYQLREKDLKMKQEMRSQKKQHLLIQTPVVSSEIILIQSKQEQEGARVSEFNIGSIQLEGSRLNQVLMLGIEEAEETISKAQRINRSA